MEQDNPTFRKLTNSLLLNQQRLNSHKAEVPLRDLLHRLLLSLDRLVNHELSSNKLIATLNKIIEYCYNDDNIHTLLKHNVINKLILFLDSSFYNQVSAVIISLLICLSVLLKSENEIFIIHLETKQSIIEHLTSVIALHHSDNKICYYISTLLTTVLTHTPVLTSCVHSLLISKLVIVLLSGQMSIKTTQSLVQVIRLLPDTVKCHENYFTSALCHSIHNYIAHSFDTESVRIILVLTICTHFDPFAGHYRMLGGLNTLPKLILTSMSQFSLSKDIIYLACNAAQHTMTNIRGVRLHFFENGMIDLLLNILSKSNHQKHIQIIAVKTLLQLIENLPLTKLDFFELGVINASGGPTTTDLRHLKSTWGFILDISRRESNWSRRKHYCCVLVRCNFVFNQHEFPSMGLIFAGLLARHKHRTTPEEHAYLAIGKNGLQLVLFSHKLCVLIASFV